MRIVYIAIMFLFAASMFGQQIPPYYIKADVPDGYVFVVYDSTATLVPQDSLTAATPVTVDSFSYSSDTLYFKLSSDATIYKAEIISGTDDQNITGSSWNLSNGELTIGIENGTSQTVDLDGRYLTGEVDGSVTNELQTVDYFDISSNELGISLSSDGVPTSTVSLLPYLDNTDDQNLSLDPKSGTDVVLNIQDGADVTLREGSNITLNRAASNLLEISATGGGIDTLVDYDALRAYSGSSTVVYVQDFTVNYSGRDYLTLGGFFVAGGSGENGATIIDGWQRVFDGVNYFPAWYEMNGYDDSGVDNQILQDNDRTNAIIRVANANGGGTIQELPGVKLIGNAGTDLGIRYGVYLLDNIDLNLNGATYKIDSALIDGSWTFNVIRAHGVSNIKIRNGYIDGNDLEQNYSTYAQNGITSGIGMRANRDSLVKDVLIENIEIRNTFGNPIWCISQDSIYTGNYQDFEVRNIRCIRYGEGPEWLNVNNLRVDNVYLDPDTVSVGDHFELVRCDSFQVTNGVIVGGSGSGSGIDLYGCRNGTVMNWHVSHTKDVMEIHRDSYTNYCENIQIVNLRGESSLETTATAISFSTGHQYTKNIHFDGLYIKDYYAAMAFSSLETVGGPVVIENFLFDSLTTNGVALATATDVTFRDGIIKNCGSHGIFWNSYQTPTLLSGEAKLKIEDVEIFNCGLNGVRLDLTSTSKTYSLKADVRVDAYDNTNQNVLFTEASGDTNRVRIQLVDGHYTPTTTSNVQQVSGVTDIYPIATLQRMDAGHEGQRIRVHGKAGGITIDELATTNGIRTIDSADVVLDTLEWMDLQYNRLEERWIETDRSDKTAIVDVHDKFIPGDEWSFTNRSVMYWDGSDFSEDVGFDYYDVDNKLRVDRISINDTLFIGADGSETTQIYNAGNYLIYKSLISNAGSIFRDHNNQNILLLSNGDKSGRFYGPLKVTGGLQDGALDFGTSGQILSSTGSGVDWIDAPSGGGGGGDVYKSGTLQANRIPYAINDSTITTESAFEYDDVSNALKIAGGEVFVGSIFGNYVEIDEADASITMKQTGQNAVKIQSDASGNMDFITNGSTVRGSILANGSEFQIGNYDFDIDQTVGAGQDNYVLKYDNSSGLISLEADATGGGGGGGDVYKTGTPSNNQHAVWVNDSTIEGSSVLTDDGTNITVSGSIGSNGQAPLAGYSFAGNGPARVYNGSNYAQIHGAGRLELSTSGSLSRYINDGSGMAQQWLGANLIYFNSSDIRLYQDVTNYEHGVFNNGAITPSAIYGLSTYADSDVVSEFSFGAFNDSGVLGFGVNGINRVEGEWADEHNSITNNGLVSRSWLMPGFEGDPHENNIFYNAHERFIVTATNTTNTAYSNWFENRYPVGGTDIIGDSTSVISIDIQSMGGFSSSGITYPQGHIYIVTYTGSTIGAATGRMRANDNVWTSLTWEGAVMTPSDNWAGDESMNAYIYRFSVPSSDVNIVEFELTLPNAQSSACQVVSIEYYPTRPEGAQTPFVSKYTDQRMTNALDFYDDTGTEQVSIDPNSTYDLDVSGGLRLTGPFFDVNSNTLNSYMTVFGDTGTVNRLLARPWHDGNNGTKIIDDGSNLQNINQSSYTDITDLNTQSKTWGDLTYTFTSSNTTIPVSGEYEVSVSLTCVSSSGSDEVLAFAVFADGTRVSQNYVTTVPAGDFSCISFTETITLSSGDLVDIRCDGDGTGVVNLFDDGNCVEIKMINR